MTRGDCEDDREKDEAKDDDKDEREEVRKSVDGFEMVSGEYCSKHGTWYPRGGECPHCK